MRLNRTSKWKVMTIGFSREHLFFNFALLDILCTQIGDPSQKLWPCELLESFRSSIWSVSINYFPVSDIRMKSYDHLNFSRGFVVQFWACRYIMRMNRKSELEVMTVWISREVPLFNFERREILCAWIGHPSEMVWPFELLESFSCSISSVLKYYIAELDIRLKSYDHLNFSRASLVQFRATRHII